MTEGFNGFHTDIQVVSDFLNRFTLSQPLEDVPFAVGKKRAGLRKSINSSDSPGNRQFGLADLPCHSDRVNRSTSMPTGSLKRWSRPQRQFLPESVPAFSMNGGPFYLSNLFLCSQ
jgi:hypothetical protein